MEKITNATVLRIPSGALLFRRYPIRSPITSAAKSPSEQASHTTTAELSPSLAPNVIAVSCVLSPSSRNKKCAEYRQRCKSDLTILNILFLIIVTLQCCHRKKQERCTCNQTDQPGRDHGTDNTSCKHCQSVEHQDSNTGSKQNILQLEPGSHCHQHQLCFVTHFRNKLGKKHFHK